MAPAISTPLSPFRTLTTNPYPLTTRPISFRMHTYEKYARNSFRMHTYKIHPKFIKRLGFKPRVRNTSEPWPSKSFVGNTSEKRGGRGEVP
jgi:hypothetical protein